MAVKLSNEARVRAGRLHRRHQALSLMRRQMLANAPTEKPPENTALPDSPFATPIEGAATSDAVSAVAKAQEQKRQISQQQQQPAEGPLRMPGDASGMMMQTPGLT